ncbi:MAG: M12 family metallopeptidase [Gammaproteobacteria bacterium]
MENKLKKNKDSNCEKNSGVLCSLPEIRERDLSHITDGNRARLISLISKMWVNGTEITFYFFKEPVKWRGGSEQEQAVRQAFETWKQLGIGLSFREVDNSADATIKIGFDQADGAWSYIGRDNIEFASDPAKRTTNFGWDLTTEFGRDTALHEIGHVLGFPHEHQNPRAGIVWDEEKVYSNLGAPPNNWSRDETFWNVIRKIPANTVDGSDWDKNSIMHYQFEAGLIKVPVEYQTKPLIPQAGLSEVDIETVRKLYPPQEEQFSELKAFESQRFTITPGEQVDYTINPTSSRKYTLQTFGKVDTVMVLFELRDGVQDYIDGNDDSGQDINAKIVAYLHRGREYIIRTRLYYSEEQGCGSVMIY